MVMTPWQRDVGLRVDEQCKAHIFPRRTVKPQGHVAGEPRCFGVDGLWRDVKNASCLFGVYLRGACVVVGLGGHPRKALP